jgi:hypothetical protein
MKRILALSVVVVSLVACKRTSDGADHQQKPEAQSPVAIIYDRMASRVDVHSNDYGPDEESEFYTKFSTAFQSEPACHGLRLFSLWGPERTPDSTWLEFGKVAHKDQWRLKVNFLPEREKQQWALQRMYSELSSGATGEGDAHSMAHSVCLIAKGTGGSVL